MKLRFLFCFPLFALVAPAQAPVYVSAASSFVANGNVILPPAPPGALVTVCNYPSSGVPCTNLAPTYNGRATSLTCPSGMQLALTPYAKCSNRTDEQGNFGFWALPGTYAYTIATPAGSLGPYIITAPATGVRSPGPVVDAKSFGLVCDGTTVNPTSVFVSLNAFLVANDNATVMFPPNSTCLLSGLGFNPLVGPDWLLGVSSASLIGDHTAIVNVQQDGVNNVNFEAGGASFICYSGPIDNPVLSPDFTAPPIRTVAAESNAITVNNPASISTWQVGDKLLIYGFDQQGYGFPPNYRYFERKTVRRVVHGTITLDSPLRFGYNSNWYYSPAANTTPPAVRNLSRPCTGSGSVKRLKRLYVQGFDFSQTVPSQTGQVPTTSAGGADYLEFDNDKFGYFFPSDAETVIVRDSVFQWIEIDKLVTSFYCFNCVVTGNEQDPAGAGVSSGSGALYVEFDNSTFLSHLNALPRTFILNSDAFYSHGSSPYAFLQNSEGYSEVASYNSPLLVANGVKEGGVYGVGGGFTVTVVAAPTPGTFTVAGDDIGRTIQVAGTGTQVKDHATGVVLGIVSDVYLNNGMLTVSGVWTTSPSPNEVIELNHNPLSVNVLNPFAVDFDINSIPPAYDATTYATVKNLNMQFIEPTLVTNLGPCNTASTHATKWVKDAEGQNALGRGGGAITAQVECQGTGQFSGSYVPVGNTP